MYLILATISEFGMVHVALSTSYRLRLPLKVFVTSLLFDFFLFPDFERPVPGTGSAVCSGLPSVLSAVLPKRNHDT